MRTVQAGTWVVLALWVVMAGALPPAGLATTQDSLPEAAKCFITFGKHRGKRVSEVPRTYLEWIVRERVYANRPDLVAALRSLKLLGTDLEAPPPASKEVETQKPPPPLPPRPLSPPPPPPLPRRRRPPRPRRRPRRRPVRSGTDRQDSAHAGMSA